MQAFFQRVDAAAYRQQTQQIADKLKEHPPPCAPITSQPRPIGRPPKKREAAAELADAAAAAEMELPAAKRGKYTKWFDSPYINDILREYVRCSFSARRAVAVLKKAAPDSRYDRLSHSTVASWYEDDKRTLRLQHQLELQQGTAHLAGRGRCPIMLHAPGAEERIVGVLVQMRDAHTPLNSHVIRWVMHAVLQKHPAVLAQLSLSQSYISKWVRNHPQLKFRWRQRTTAASKLPLDWESQGIDMAKRIAARMHLHKVSFTRNT